MEDKNLSDAIFKSIQNFLVDFTINPANIPPEKEFRCELVISKNEDGVLVEIKKPKFVKRKPVKTHEPINEEEWTKILSLNWPHKQRAIIERLKELENNATIDQIKKDCPWFTYNHEYAISAGLKIACLPFGLTWKNDKVYICKIPKFL